MPTPNVPGEIADVGEALDVVGATTVAADGPLTVRENLRGRHKPQSSVAEERRRRRARRRSRVVEDDEVASRLTLCRGCP